MTVLDDSEILCEGFIGALYPFTDIAALVTAIVLAKMSTERWTQTISGVNGGGTMNMGGSPERRSARMITFEPRLLRGILVDTLRSPVISALLVACFGHSDRVRYRL